MTAEPTGGLLGSLAGISSGSGSARLGLSQKGDLPSSGEPVGFCWFKVANARNRPPTCFAAIDVTGTGRGIFAAVPVEIVKGGVGKTLEPALSRHERTAFENGLGGSRTAPT